jgi:hypothetical protein
MTSEEPALSGGVVAVITVSLTKVKQPPGDGQELAVMTVPPMTTSLTSVNPVPLIVIDVPTPDRPAAGTTLVTIAETSVGTLLRPTWARRHGRLDTGLAVEIGAVVKEATAATGLLVAARTAARATTGAAVVTTGATAPPLAPMSVAKHAPPSRSPRALIIRSSNRRSLRRSYPGCAVES